MERSFHRRGDFWRYFLEERRQQAFHFRAAKRAGRMSFSYGKGHFFPIVRKMGKRFFKSGKVRRRIRMNAGETEHGESLNRGDNYFGTGGSGTPKDLQTGSPEARHRRSLLSDSWEPVLQQ
jgi:hypothetical protein